MIFHFFLVSFLLMHIIIWLDIKIDEKEQKTKRNPAHKWSNKRIPIYDRRSNKTRWLRTWLTKCDTESKINIHYTFHGVSIIMINTNNIFIIKLLYQFVFLSLFPTQFVFLSLSFTLSLFSFFIILFFFSFFFILYLCHS